MKRKIVRGNLEYVGVMGKNEDTIKGQIKNVIILTFLLFIDLFALILSIMGKGMILGTPTLAIIVWSILLLILVILLNKATGFEIDGIYERGLSHRYTTLVDRIIGNNFCYYQDVAVVHQGITTTPKGKSEYIRYFRSKKSRVNPYFCKNLYKNKFYDKLAVTLKERCLHAKWEKIDETE